MEQKRLLQLMAERIAADPALMERAARVTTAEELCAFAKSEGAELGAETAAHILPRFRALAAGEGQLEDDALDAVAGGVCSSCQAGSGMPGC